MLFTILVALAVLGALVFFHELGHFIVAKLFGVRVYVFSLGFGRRLFGFKRGHTDYRVSAIPFGGYVKMAGEEPQDEKTGAPDEFTAKPRWQRLCIAFAGPFANLVLAVLVLAALYAWRYEEPAYLNREAIVGYVVPESPAALAGFTEGDRITEVNQRPTSTWSKAIQEIALGGGKSLDVVVEHDGAKVRRTLDVSGADIPTIGSAGLLPQEVAVVGFVAENSPASRAGILPGDVIQRINASVLHSPFEFSGLLQRSNGDPAGLDIRRGGYSVSLEVTPTYLEAEQRWYIGISFVHEMSVKSLPLPDAFVESLRRNAELATLTGRSLTGMVAGRVSPKQAMGPVGIVQFTGQIARQGAAELLGFLALLSLSIGIFNLLPIPVLDGGVIFILLLEMALRRDLSQKFKERLSYAGMAFLLLFIAFATVNDIARAWGIGLLDALLYLALGLGLVLLLRSLRR